MAEEIRNASNMIQNSLIQQPRGVKVSAIRKALPFSFTILIMALDQLNKENKLSIERSRDRYSCRIWLKR